MGFNTMGGDEEQSTSGSTRKVDTTKYNTLGANLEEIRRIEDDEVKGNDEELSKKFEDDRAKDDKSKNDTTEEGDYKVRDDKSKNDATEEDDYKARDDENKEDDEVKM